MQPEMIPAMPQAAATVMAPRPPASRASMHFAREIRFSLSNRLTTMESRMA